MQEGELDLDDAAGEGQAILPLAVHGRRWSKFLLVTEAVADVAIWHAGMPEPTLLDLGSFSGWTSPLRSRPH